MVDQSCTEAFAPKLRKNNSVKDRPLGPKTSEKEHGEKNIFGSQIFGKKNFVEEF